LLEEQFIRWLQGGGAAIRYPSTATEYWGREAVILWWRYQTYHDRKALDLLLAYNKEDVVNLMTLRGKLERFSKSRYCD
jgi:uncharacterized protein YprB with RNaseH-like and TPR domain